MTKIKASAARLKPCPFKNADMTPGETLSNLRSKRTCVVAKYAGQRSGHVVHILFGHGRGERQGDGSFTHKRSVGEIRVDKSKLLPVVRVLMHRDVVDADANVLRIQRGDNRLPINPKLFQHQKRSEEHTSELQSLRHLVCRL